MSRDEDLDRVMAWNEVLDESSYYELLGVLDLADVEAIRAAFREFAAAFHPDVHRGEDADILEAIHRVFRRGAEAYRVLSDPELRGKYDLALAAGHLRLVEGASGGGPGTSGRKTLEDLCNTPAGRLSARRADQLIGEGRLEEARKLLRVALSHEGSDNPELEERIEALELFVFAKGE